MSSPDNHREKATYILFKSHVRPVEEANGVRLVLSYSEYMTVRSAVEWVQRLGTMPIPLLRLIRDDDVVIKSFASIKMVLRYLSGFCKRSVDFPSFESNRCQYSPVEMEVQFPEPTTLGVESVYDLTQKALEELKIKPQT